MTLDETARGLAYYLGINPRFGPDISKPAVISFWFEAMRDVPLSSFRRVMDRLIKEDRFPSIKDVELSLGSAVSPLDDAIVISGKIADAIGKYGSWGPEEAKKFLGSVGWEVVKMSGGWGTVCEVEYHDLGMMKAQWRESARALLERGGRSLPELPPPMPDRGLRLVSDIMTSLGVSQDKNRS